MANFDVAIGMDFGFFNSLLSDVWNYPPQQFVLTAGGASATFTVTCYPPILAANPNLQPIVTISILSLAVASASLTTTTNASATFSFEIDSNPSGSLTVRVGTCSIETSDPKVTSLAQQFGLGGSLVNFLNQFLSGITIPALSFEGLNFVQVCEVGPSNDSFLMLYGGYTPVVLPSGGTAWPPDLIFVALDAAALSAAVAGYFPLNKSGSWSGGSFLGGSVTAGYSVKVSAPDLSPATGNQISASGVGLSGSANFCYHTPNPPYPLPSTPDIYASVSISGDLSFSAALTAQSDGSNQDIYLTLININISSLSLDGLSNDIFGSVTDALTGAISDALSAFLNGYTIKVATVSSFSGIMPVEIVMNTIAAPVGPMATVMFELALTVPVTPGA
jgi:hypothetical protein